MENEKVELESVIYIFVLGRDTLIGQVFLEPDEDILDEERERYVTLLRPAIIMMQPVPTHGPVVGGSPQIGMVTAMGAYYTDEITIDLENVLAMVEIKETSPIAADYRRVFAGKLFTIPVQG